MPSSSPPPIDLTKAAKICADLARVLDAGDLPLLLTRAADVLKAPGLIVWVADQNGQTLYPLLTHGYPAATLMKMGSLLDRGRQRHRRRVADRRTPRRACNERSAWRTGGADRDIRRAVWAFWPPEVKDGRELRGEVRALATIFAAQLATIVTPVAAAGGRSLVAEA